MISYMYMCIYMGTPISDYTQIMTYLEGDAKSSCPTGFTCETENIGKSVEGRNLKVFKVNPAAYIHVL